MDVNRIEELIEIANAAAVSEITVRQDGGAVTIKKGVKPAWEAESSQVASIIPAETAPARPEHEEQQVQNAALEITAPMVGLFHSSGLGIAVGMSVAKGQVVGAIESMKLMNDVKSDVQGTVIEVLAEDDTPVEYGQTLFRIESAV
jgi:biotin carboxyl carrier protein